jgi:glycerol-3-phosphate dehydrogenase
VAAQDLESGQAFEARARIVVNAAGPFCDAVRRLADPAIPSMIRPSQGVHLVFGRDFLPGDSAIMVPHTDDGRVLFAVPWHERILVGTTDTPVPAANLEPRPLADEVAFLLRHAARYLTRDPAPSDVLCAFAGLRPLVRAGAAGNTASMSREHLITTSASGLVSITGGKWTTYRRMGEEVVDVATKSAGLAIRPCGTESLPIHDFDGAGIDALAAADPELARPLHPRLPYRCADVVWAARHEMARTVEDALSRRTRALLLDARASMEAAPVVARLLARETGRDEAWEGRQIDLYRALAGAHLIA